MELDDNKEAGFLSDINIRQLLDKDIVICGYEERNLTDIGYNLTPTEFIFSVNNGALLKIYNQMNEKFCFIEPNDTVLILTREAIWVSEKIGGTFHSKVKIVSDGFGHISTTLDANWEGPLLISLNNPTKKKLKFQIAEDKGDGVKYKSFVTLILYKMLTPTKNAHDNPPCRLDILKEKVKKPRFIDWTFGDYCKLESIIEKIRDFEGLVVNIGQAKDEKDRAERIQNFYKKYDAFTENLEFHINQAHAINNKIIFKGRIRYWVRTVIISFIGLILLGWGFKCWRNSDSNTLSLIAILIAVYVLFLNKFVFEEREKI